MTCLECQAYIPLPPDDDQDAVCLWCGAVYELAEDMGWFKEFIGIYVPKSVK